MLCRPGKHHRAALALASSLLLAPPGVAGAAAPAPNDVLWQARVLGDPVPPLSHEGRWLVDAAGRVVLLHGVNYVQKSAPFYPSARGFDADDAAFLAERGLLVFRLGVVPEAILPAPGVVDVAYVEKLAETVSVLAAKRIFVLLDFHQDGWGPVTWGNGMPAWMTYTDGLPNPQEPFPTYYLTNPALQRAFENFWANREGPDGVPLQGHFAEAARLLAERFRDERYVLGFDALNEPWPGADWSPCLTGCPDQELRLMAPFYQRVADAVRAGGAKQIVFSEPFVLFNFGQTGSALPAFGTPNAGFSFHVYPFGPADEVRVMDRAIAHSQQAGDALLATEWGATNDGAAITRTASTFDDRLLPWIFWAYNENVIRNTTLPPTPANLRLPVVDALTRPYPVAVNGTPTRLAFDPATRRLELAYGTRQPGGRKSAWLETVLAMPAATYPTGYRVSVQGASITSRPNAPRLKLYALPKAETVELVVTPAP